VSEQDRAVCLGVGMDSFLSKPIKREHLLRILREWTAGPD
jgi:CheY-like chemotaxis protein